MKPLSQKNPKASKKQGTVYNTLQGNRQELVIALAEGLEKYCKEWGYNYMMQLKQNPSVDTFKKQFLKITRTYFFVYGQNMYGADFDKKENIVKIYMCGKDWRKILLVCPIESIIRELKSGWSKWDGTLI